MTNKRTKHTVDDIVIVSGAFYAVPDRVIKVVEIHTKGEYKGRITCEDINGHGYIGHNDDFLLYTELDRDTKLWQSINHDHQWLVDKPVKELTTVDKMEMRIKELEDRNDFLEKAMMNLLEKIGR